MASWDNNNGGGEDKPKYPPLFNPELAAEMAKINGTMTRAGQKSRPGRGILGAAHDGRGRAAVLPPSRGSPVGTGGRGAARGGGVARGGVGMLGHHFVRPSSAPLTTEPTLLSPAVDANPPHLRGLRSFQAVPPPASLTTSTLVRQSLGASTGNERGPPKPSASSNWDVGNGAGFGVQPTSFGTHNLNAPWGIGEVEESQPQPVVQPTNIWGRGAEVAGTTPSGNTQTSQSERTRARAGSVTGHMEVPRSTPSGPPIVSNWGPDPVGPIIPGHLHQPSAKAAIEEISRITGIPMWELTTDGVSIPAARPVQAAANPDIRPSLGSLPVVVTPPVHTGRQPDVSADTFFHGVGGFGGGRGVAPTRHGIIHNEEDDPMEDVEMEDNDEHLTDSVAHQSMDQRWSNLDDSIWAAPSPPSPPVACNLTPAFGPVDEDAAVSLPQVAPYANPAALTANTNPKVAEKTLKDSMWA